MNSDPIYFDENSTWLKGVYGKFSYDYEPYMIRSTSYFVYQSIEKICRPVLQGLIAIVGLLSNLLMILTVGLNRGMRTTRHVLVLNLSVASMCLLVILPLTTIITVTDDWPFGDVWCKLHSYLLDVSFYATVYTLLAIALCEFHDSVYPCLSSCVQRVGNKAFLYTILCVIVAWLLFLACRSPIITYMQTKNLGIEGYTTCNLDMTNEEIRKLALCDFVMLYFVPLSFSLCLYICVLVKHFHLHVRNTFNVTRDEVELPTHRRDTVTYLIMTIVVIVLLGPKLIDSFVREVIKLGHIDYSRLYALAVSIFYDLSYIPSSVFPIIIFARSKDLQRGLRKTLCCVIQSIQNRNFNRTDSIGLRTVHISE